MPSAAAAKLIVQFLGSNGEEWAEEYWSNLSSPLVAVLDDATINLRLKFLAAPHKITRLRWVMSNASRLGKQQDVFKPGLRVDTTSTGASYMPCDTALVYKLYGSAGGSRHLWVRGLTEDCFSIGAGGKPVTDAGIDRAIRAWIKALGTLGYGIRALNSVPLRPPNVVPISSVDGSAGGSSVVTCGGPHGLAVGDEVILYRTSDKDLPRLRGHWFVGALGTTPATQFVIPYQTPRSAGPVPATGLVRKAEYGATQAFIGDATNVKFQHVGHHDTREKVFGSRGRSPAKRLRATP